MLWLSLVSSTHLLCFVLFFSDASVISVIGIAIKMLNTGHLTSKVQLKQECLQRNNKKRK